MKITLTAVPKLLSSFFIDVEAIANDESIINYAQRMKEFIFGRETMKCAALMDLDLFDLVLYKGMSFRDIVIERIKNYTHVNKENLMTAILICYLYKGKHIRIIPLSKSGESIIIGEPELLRLSIIDTQTDYNRINRRLDKKYGRNRRRNYEPEKSFIRYSDTIQMAVVKYYMKQAINNKEFMDKLNFRRFSTGLRLNNRPADIEDINNLLRKRRNMTFIDLTDSSSRINLSALYTVVFKKVGLSDIYDSKKVFEPSSVSEEVYSRAASEFINIIYNGNGIEISDILVKMAEGFSKIEMPVLTPGKLNDIIENFNIIYAAAAISHKFDKAFTEHEMLKKSMRHRMIDNYWNVYCNIIQFKKFGSVVAFCYLLANLDLNKYRDDISYSEEVMNEFAEAEKAVKEINKEVHGL